jgi:hypothetical protein
LEGRHRAAFLFALFAAVRWSRMAHRVISLRRKLWSLLEQQRTLTGDSAKWLGRE